MRGKSRFRWLVLMLVVVNCFLAAVYTGSAQEDPLLMQQNAEEHVLRFEPSAIYVVAMVYMLKMELGEVEVTQVTTASITSKAQIGVSAEIDVQRPAGTSVANGGTDNVGTQAVGELLLTYTIDNTAGSSRLTITGVTASSLVNSSGFSVGTTLPLVVAVGATEELQVSFDVTTAGAFSLAVDIDNNDFDEDPYNFTIQGTGTGLGDVDTDGKIDVLDIRLCYQIALGVIEGTSAQRIQADFDGDGDVDMDDATALAEHVIGMGEASV